VRPEVQVAASVPARSFGFDRGKRTGRRAIWGRDRDGFSEPKLHGQMVESALGEVTVQFRFTRWSMAGF